MFWSPFEILINNFPWQFKIYAHFWENGKKGLRWVLDKKPRKRLWPEAGVDHLKNARTDHHTVKPNQSQKVDFFMVWYSKVIFVLLHSISISKLKWKPVKTWFKVDPGSKCVHPNEHLSEKEAEKNIPWNFMWTVTSPFRWVLNIAN